METLTSSLTNPDVAPSSKPECAGYTAGGNALLRKSWLSTLVLALLDMLTGLPRPARTAFGRPAYHSSQRTMSLFKQVYVDAMRECVFACIDAPYRAGHDSGFCEQHLSSQLLRALLHCGVPASLMPVALHASDEALATSV